ncbi:MAG: hypothetical protein ABIK96_12115 [bacterium]
MDARTPPPRNYWNLLDAADGALTGGDFPLAEIRFQQARAVRESSPGRVFLTEKVGDRLRRMLQRREDKGADLPEDGRWAVRTRQFTDRFLDEGNRIVREGLRLSELRPEDEAETNQPLLEQALYLVSRSGIFPGEPRSAVPLLKGLIRSAFRTGRPFDVMLLRHDLPFGEEERLWLANKSADMLDAFVEMGSLEPGSNPAQEWARATLQLLQPQYFGTEGRLAEERAWLEALTADRLLKRPSACVSLYRDYLKINPAPGPRADEARVRILEILANAGSPYLPVPRYAEALAAMQSAGLAQGSAHTGRFRQALACIEYRHPPAPGDRLGDLAWASVGAEPDGSLAVVYWWDDQPRDLAFWRPGEDASALDGFLAPCGGRIVAADPQVTVGVGQAWENAPGAWSAEEFAAALLEPVLPGGVPDPDALLDVGLAEGRPWRDGWSGQLAHPLLKPPTGPVPGEVWRQRKGASALLAGLVVLALRTRLARSDPALRAGIGELARRGDSASSELYGLATLGKAAELALDGSFEAWTLPLLWTRGSPIPAGENAAGAGTAGAREGLRPDLGRHDLAVISTGNPAAALAAWGQGQTKWRVVLDRPERLEDLAQIAGQVVGPVTLVPAGGLVHDLDAALETLESFLQGPWKKGDPASGLLALFHWVRLVESHNGDLLDFLEARPTSPGCCELYDLYRAVVADLPRSPAGDPGPNRGDGWPAQYAQRSRKSGLVAGSARDIGMEPALLDAAWGVFEGSDASWVFLDSAAIHADLAARGEQAILDLHRRLHGRGHRHLSLLTGAVWLRSDLESLLQDWLGVFGRAYDLALADLEPPLLRLVDRAVRPDAQVLAGRALAEPLAWLRSEFSGSELHLLLPGPDTWAGAFWAAVRDGDLGDNPAAWVWHGSLESPACAPEARGQAVLALPVLRALEDPGEDPGTGEVPASGKHRLTLRLSALEVAAMLAGRWSEVVVLDPRWWHQLWSPQAVAGRARNFSGPAAAESAGAPGARLFSLPALGEGRGAPAAEATLTRTQAWLRGVAGVPAGGDGHERLVRPESLRGVRLETGTRSEVWGPILQGIRAAREQGDLARWALILDARRPDPFLETSLADCHPGVSIWEGEAPVAGPASVMWVRPHQIADKALGEFLEALPPAVVLAGDLADWLPGRLDEQPDAALALRYFLSRKGVPLVLQTSPLAPPWRDFLAGFMGDGDALPGRDLGDAGVGRQADRLRILLARLRPVLTARRPVSGGAPVASTNELVPLDWLARLAGLEPAAVARGIRTLRWAARLTGEPLSAAEGAGATAANAPAKSHAMLIPRRFAEMEKELADVEEVLGILLPLWLEGVDEGTSTWVDLAGPPVKLESSRLMRVDGILAALGSGSASASFGYVAPAGMLGTNRRLLECRVAPGRVLDELRLRLDQFRNQLREALDSAVETPTGFLVDSGLTTLTAGEIDFLSLGSALGFWRWLGPACPGALHLVDVLALADSRAGSPGHPGWSLWRDLLAAEAEERAAATGDESDQPGEAGAGGTWESWKRLLSAGGRGGDDLDREVDRIAAFAAEAQPGQLVLRGVAGTGRHEALIRGLLAGAGQSSAPAEVRIYCPDSGVAAWVTEEFLRLGGPGPLDLVVPDGAGQLGNLGLGGGGLADAAGTLIVMCEVQRFAPELRYKIAQLGRGRRLVMTVDPAAAEEGWEQLFLTVPRNEQVMDFRQQRRQERRVWSLLRQLVPEAGRAGSGTRHPGKGVVVSEYAANLDQCVGYLTARDGAPDPTGFLRLTAGVPADLEYLGGSLRDQGWFAVEEEELDDLLLPGPREVAAAIGDLLAVAGELGPQGGSPSGRDESEAPGPRPGARDRGHPDGIRLLLPRLVEAPPAAAWAEWCAARAHGAGDLTVASFAATIRKTAWLTGQAAYPEARRRIGTMVRRYGHLTLGDFAATAVWGVQRTVLGGEADGSGAGRPTALLARASRIPGRWVGRGMYLCLGSEHPHRHYLHWSRIESDLLVLYQEQSPLPGTGGPNG